MVAATISAARSKHRDLPAVSAAAMPRRAGYRQRWRRQRRFDMRRALWPSVATIGAAIVIYAEATHSGMTFGGRDSSGNRLVGSFPPLARITTASLQLKPLAFMHG
jgi:hypothetical protein